VQKESPAEVDLDLLSPNPFQPRLHFDETKLEELAQSIRANGLIQPILVRKAGARYEIIAGERRWRAAQRAGLLKVPVVVREVADDKLLQVALIENIQREDLNPIDEAIAYRRLLDEFHLTQEDLAQSVGKDRSSIANALRLLKLPEEAKAHVASGALSMGHARALLGVEQEAALLDLMGKVMADNLSVRDTERLVRRLSEAADMPATPEAVAEPDVHTKKAEETMRLALGTRVRILRKGKGGRVEIEFVSEDELHRIYEYITERR